MRWCRWHCIFIHIILITVEVMCEDGFLRLWNLNSVKTIVALDIYFLLLFVLFSLHLHPPPPPFSARTTTTALPSSPHLTDDSHIRGRWSSGREPRWFGQAASISGKVIRVKSSTTAPRVQSCPKIHLLHRFHMQIWKHRLWACVSKG